jgi:hypothetical protein
MWVGIMNNEGHLHASAASHFFLHFHLMRDLMGHTAILDMIKGTTVRFAISGTSGTNGLLDIIIFHRLERYSNLMDRPSHLICCLMSCPMFRAALSIPFPSLLTQHCVCIILKQTTRHQYFTLLIISQLVNFQLIELSRSSTARYCSCYFTAISVPVI